ncbi:hypothetical protein WG66_005921 [Moniliophthora roreri]|nr:hypothetical protein WG66_005921 [Moniliophthora roreri]
MRTKGSTRTPFSPSSPNPTMSSALPYRRCHLDGKPKKDIYMEHLGKKFFITRDNHGNETLKEEDMPFVMGSTLKFEGFGDNLAWNDTKEPMCDMFESRTPGPFIDHSGDDNHDLVGFHAALSEDYRQGSRGS